MQDVLILYSNHRSSIDYQVIEAANHAPGPPEQTLIFVLIRHWSVQEILKID